MNEGGEIIGMVDVLKLTYATLEQINTMSTGDSEGPAWSRFWLSMENDTESMVSGDGSLHHTTSGAGGRPRMMSPELSRGPDRTGDHSLAPGDSASHAGDEPRSPIIEIHSPRTPVEEIPFSFKFKAPSGRVHRFKITASQGISELISAVISKLGNEIDAVGGVPSLENGKIGSSGFALSYLDDDDDTVSITTDNDLLEAVILARQTSRDKVDLFVHKPNDPPTKLNSESHISSARDTSTPSKARERKHTSEKESDEESHDGRAHKIPSNKVAPQIVAGIPNDLLLPGAIISLSIVIVGVFTLSRLTR